MRSRLAAVVALALVFFATVIPTAARAAREFAHVERVEVEPYWANLARVRVWLDLLHIEGILIDGVKPDDLILVAGSTRLKQIPGLSRFEYSGDEMDVVVMVYMGFSSPFADDAFSDKITEFLGKGLPKSARVSVMTYGGYVKNTPFDEPATAAKKWTHGYNSPEDESNAPRLLYALDKSIKLLKGVEPRLAANSTRKLIILLSNGVDEETDQATVRAGFNKIVKQANDAGITIHTLAFSNVDNRKPYLNLAQLSKKTSGMFRMAPDAASFPPNLEALKIELRRQLVLTFFVPMDLVSGKTLKVLCKSDLCGSDLPLESNVEKAPPIRCAGATCDTGATCVDGNCMTLTLGAGGGGFGLIAVIGLAVLVVLGGGGVLLRKRTQTTAQVRAAVKGGGTSPGAAAAPQQVAVRKPKLTIMSGPLTGQVIPLRHGLTIGKSPSAGLILQDPMRSGTHAQFIVDGGGNCSIADMGSSNGTFVNGQRTPYMQLPNGAMIRIGQTDIRFSQG